MTLQFLKAAWHKWTLVARKVADFQARLLLSLFYFAVLPLFALLLRLSSDPLQLNRETPGRWWPRPGGDIDPLLRARRQF